MRDFESVAADLRAQTIVARPPVAAVAARAHRLRTRRRAGATAAAVAVAVGVVLPIRWAAGESHHRLDIVGRPGRTAAGVNAGGGATTTTASSPTPRPLSAPPSGAGAAAHAGPTVPAQRGPACGEAGATDAGVTARTVTILLDATLDGPSAAEAATAADAVRAVMAAVNRAGGVCGRRVAVREQNGFTAPGNDVLAAIVGPLQPDLDTYVDNGSADRLAVPSVSTDGLTPSQYRSAWVWPVGQTLAPEARISVAHTYGTLGARSFALVYRSNAFGSTGLADAFRAYVASLPGASVTAVIDAAGVSPEVAYEQACGQGQCDDVVLALPSNEVPTYANGSARLATDALWTSFAGLANACRQSAIPNACRSTEVWLPFTPPLAPFTDDSAVAAYRDAVRGDSNPFTESGYVAASVLVDALRMTGPVVTRARLGAALNALRYESALVSPLAWGPAGSAKRAANRAARAVRYDNGSFADAGTGWVADPGA